MTTALRPTTAAAVTVPAATNGEIDRVGCAVVVVNMNARSFVQSWPRRRPQSDVSDNSPADARPNSAAHADRRPSESRRRFVSDSGTICTEIEGPSSTPGDQRRITASIRRAVARGTPDDVLPGDPDDHVAGRRERRVALSIPCELGARRDMELPAVAFHDDGRPDDHEVDLESLDDRVELGGREVRGRRAASPSPVRARCRPACRRAARPAPRLRRAAMPVRPWRAWRSTSARNPVGSTNPAITTCSTAAATPRGSTAARSHNIRNGLVTAIPSRVAGTRSARSVGRWISTPTSSGTRWLRASTRSTGSWAGALDAPQERGRPMRGDRPATDRQHGRRDPLLACAGRAPQAGDAWLHHLELHRCEGAVPRRPRHARLDRRGAGDQPMVTERPRLDE